MEEVKIPISLEDGGFENGAKRILDRMEDTQREVKKTGMSVDDFAKHMQEVYHRFDKLTAAVNENTSAISKGSIATKQLGRDLDDTTEKGVAGFGRLEKAAIGFFTLQKAKEFVGNVYEVRSEIEKTETSLRILVGNKAQADALLASIRKFAVETPMQMKDFAGAAQAMMGFGIAVEDVMENLEAIGNVAMGDSQKFQSLVLAFSQTSATGKLMGQDFLQMVNAGFNPLDQMAKTTGKSMATLKKEMSDGAISADMVRQAFIDATSEGGKFNGMLEAQSKDLAGAYSNLEGAIDDMFNKIGQNSEGIMKGAIDVATVLAKNYETVGNVLLQLIATYGSYKVAVMVVTAAEAVLNGTYTVKIRLLRAAAVAQQLLNKTMLANPFVAVATAVMAVVSALVIFRKRTDESADALDKLRDAALEDTQKLATYRAVIENVDKTSAQYKNTLRDLNAMASEYHTTLFNEKDTVEQLTAKYNELTEAIRANAAEKILSEAASKATKDAMEAEKNAMTELMEEAADATFHVIEEGVVDTGEKVIAGYQVVEKESVNLRNITSATWNQISSLVMENARKMADAFEESPEKGKTAVEDMVSQIEGILKSLGVTDKEIKEFHDDLYEYVEDSAKGFKDSYNELRRTEAQLRGIASAATTTKDVTNEAIDQMNYEQLQDQLKKVQKEIDDVNAKDIDIDVKDAQLLQLRNLLQEINNLIPKQLTVGSDADLERRLKQLKEDRDSYVYGSAEWNAKNAEIATLNKTLSGHKSRYAENASRNGGGSGRSRKAQAQKEQQEYLALIEQQERERERAVKDMEFSTTQATIDSLQDGTEKTLAQLRLNFERQKVEIERGYEDLKQEKIDAARRLFESDPANKNKVFDPTKVNTSYTKAESDNYEALLAANQKAYDRALAEQRKAQEQHLLDYIRTYGSIQDQKAAIAKSYEQKIADEQGAIQKKALEAERDRLLSELDFKELQESIDWESVFGDLSRKSTSALRDLKSKLRQALDTKDISIENAKILSEKILEIEDTITGKTDVLASILPGLRERKRLTEQAAAAEELYQKALERESASINKVLSDKQQIKDLLDSVEIRDALGQKITVELEAISEENKERLLSSLDKDSDLYKRLLQLFENLAADTTAQNNNHQSTERSRSHAKELKESLDSGNFKQLMGDLFNFEGMGFMEIASLVNSNAQSMAEFTDKIGLAGTDFGDAVHGFADGVGGFNSAVQSLASGDVFGAMNGVLDGIAGFGRMGISIIAGGGNEERLEEEIAELSESQKILADAIEYFAGKIKDDSATNAESIEYYQKALDAERDWREKQQQKIDDRASEYANSGYGFMGLAGKSSFNYHMAGNGWEGWQIFSRILSEHIGESGVTHNSVNRNNIWDLSPEEMELLKSFAPKEWEKLFSGDGHRNPEELVEEYITHSGKLEEYISYLNEKLTGYTWDGFLDSYKSLLKNLDSTTEDFADHINELITNALIESFVNSEAIQGKIKDLYAMIAKYAGKDSEGGTDLTEGEIDDIRRANEDIANTTLEWREAMKKAGLIKDTGEATDEAVKYFENLRDMWLSTLTDMEADAESWQKEITRIMVEDLINSLVLGDDFEAWLADWKERYADELAHGGDADRLKALVDEMVAKRKELAEQSQGIMDDLGYSDMIKEIEESEDVFEDLHSDFLDALMDMDTDAEEWGKKIGETLARQIIEQQLLSQAFDGLLDEWKSAVADLVQNGFGHIGGDEQTLDMLKGKIAEIVEKYKELAPLAQEFLEALGLVEESKPETPFKNLRQSFLNSLLDMKSDAESFRRELDKTLVQDMIEKFIFDVKLTVNGQDFDNFDGYLEDWNRRYLEIFQNGELTQEQKESQLQALIDELMVERDLLDQASADLRERLKEPDDTFKTMSDGWVSTLLDMDATAEDWAEEIGRTMARKIIEQMMVTSMIQPLLDNLQDAFNTAMSRDGATWESVLPELTPYIEEIKTAFGDMQPMVEQILNSFGIFKEEVVDDTITSMRENWLSALMDMKAGTADFVNDIKRLLTQKLVEKLVLSSQFDTWLEGIQSQYDAILNSDMSEEQAAAAMNKLAAEWEAKAKEMQEQTQAIFDLTGWSAIVEQMNSPLADLRSSFRSALMDMENDTEDFTNEISKLLTEAFIDRFVLGDEFDKRLSEWQEQYAAIMKGNYSEEERASLLKQLQEAIAAAKEGYAEEAQAIHDLMGTGNTQDQGATMNMADKATYDQFETYLGIAVAQQMATLQGNDVREQILATLRGLTGITSPGGDTVKEIRSLLNTTNEYLLDIKRTNRSILEQFGMKIDNIIGKLTKLV